MWKPDKYLRKYLWVKIPLQLQFLLSVKITVVQAVRNFSQEKNGADILIRLLKMFGSLANQNRNGKRSKDYAKTLLRSKRSAD